MQKHATQRKPEDEYLMPTLAVSVERIKMLLKENGVNTDQVPIAVLKQAIFNTSTSDELRSINKKIQTLRGLGLIKEIREGIWRID